MEVTLPDGNVLGRGAPPPPTPAQN
jgi:hypothetical protein